MKQLRYIFGVLILAVIVMSPAYPQYQIHRVVIDAGHGGKDPGALGLHSAEKNIALAIALKTGEYIEKNLPGVEVIYTRKTDVFVELYKRAQIANDSKANLFISIHCNASKSSSPSGTETYVMGLHKSEANLEVAKKENAAIFNEENFAKMYEGFDPNQDEDYITLSMFQNAFLEQSTMVADEIEKEFRERAKRKDRGVFQAGFLVLYRTTMPGVLVETGFISNDAEEHYLMSEDGQALIASAIFRSVKNYKEETERKDNKFTSSGKHQVFQGKKYKDLPDIREYKEGKLFKYSSGNFRTYDEALKHQKFVREKKKYKDAFIICFEDDKRISLEKALEMTKK